MSNNSARPYPPANDHRLRILFVEDEDVFAEFIARRLHFHCAQNQIQVASTLADAIAALIESWFDLILLDVNLPDSAGIKTLKKIHEVDPATPIVVLSGEECETLALDCLRAGAQDYLFKSTVDDYKLLRSIRFAMERRERLHLEAELHAMKRIEDLEHELATARQIQQSLLPTETPQLKEVDVAGAMFPAEHTAGDHYDFLVPVEAMGEGVNGITVGDVSGHGFGPAMFMAQTCGCIRSFALLEGDPGKILALTNSVLVPCANAYFVTLFLCYLNPSSMRVHYSSAGHPAYLMSPEGKVEELEPTGTILGAMPGITWPTEVTRPLESGDLLVVYTDGLVEAVSGSLEQFGDERAWDCIRKHRDQSAEVIIEKLREQLLEFTGTESLDDDVTIVILRVR